MNVYYPINLLISIKKLKVINSWQIALNLSKYLSKKGSYYV